MSVNGLISEEASFLDGPSVVLYHEMMNAHTVKKECPLLDYLIKTFPPNKRTVAKQLLKYGAVILNGKIVTQYNHLLKPGDEIRFRPKPKEAVQRPRFKTSFPIVHEDGSLIVIDKPSGLLSIATEKIKTRTAYHELTNYVRSNGMTGKERIFIVHRLDRDASGLMVFAKNEKAKFALQKNWEEAEKKYYAIVEGVPNKKSDTIESHLIEDKFRRVYSTKESKYSRYAATRYRVLKFSGKHALLEVLLLTGRKNQIRVHLSELGYPILGDEKYGTGAGAAGRLGLHAFRLSFKHPETGQPLVFESPLPESLEKVVYKMRAV